MLVVVDAILKQHGVLTGISSLEMLLSNQLLFSVVDDKEWDYNNSTPSPVYSKFDGKFNNN